MNAAKLTAETGWKPRHVLDEALPALVMWYHEHGAWADAIRSGEYRKFYDKLYGNR
jgi:dTDP-glucose 4,6-dehydratase